jgi:hypothetical protein
LARRRLGPGGGVGTPTAVRRLVPSEGQGQAQGAPAGHRSAGDGYGDGVSPAHRSLPGHGAVPRHVRRSPGEQAGDLLVDAVRRGILAGQQRGRRHGVACPRRGTPSSHLCVRHAVLERFARTTRDSELLLVLVRRGTTAFSGGRPETQRLSRSERALPASLVPVLQGLGATDLTLPECM